ncbi:MAG: DUF2878 domain-containing protein [Caldimonas sp.]
MKTPALPGLQAPAGWAATAAGKRPTRRMMLVNFLLSQAAWFAAVLGAAHHRPLASTLCVLTVIGWHLAVSARPAREARLVVAASLLGLVVETSMALLGNVAYPSGQPDLRFAPYWMVALWALLAISLNVTLRWLRPRPLLAAMLGAAAGPLAFASGVRLGGAQFIHTVPALFTLALAWGVALPVLIRLSTRFDGVLPLEARHA